MKTNAKTSRSILGVGVALAAAALLSVTAHAGEPMKPMKEGEMFMMKPITSPQDVTGLKAGDTVAMACPKCKTITVTHLKTEKGHINTTTASQEHLCPGCEQKFVVVGEGKNKHDTITHVCRNCGSTDAFCCVMRKGAAPTGGMERK